MVKKAIGLSIAALLIGTMIVIMVKSNIEQLEPIDEPLATGGSTKPTEEPGLKIGETPPDFELTTISGDLIKLSDLKGRKVVLNFWTSWCTWCKAEMPYMENYYQQYKESANVEIIAVNMTDSERQGIKGVQRFVDAYGLTFPIPLDIDGEMEIAYRIISIPTTYMIGTDGKIGQQIVGPMDEDRMKDLVDNLE